MQTSLKLELALSALINHCQQLIERGQLSNQEELKLNELIHQIKQALTPNPGSAGRSETEPGPA